MALAFAISTLLSFLPLQGLENESVVEEQETDDDPSPFSDPFGWLAQELSFLVDPFVTLSEQLMNIIFSAPYVETEGPLTFGQADFGMIDSVLTGDLVPYAFNRAYPHVWLGEAGGMAIAGILIMVVGIMIRGVFDMVDYSQGRNSSKNSYIVGFLSIVLWYPTFLAIVNVTHGIMLTFTGDAGLGYGIIGAFVSTLTSIAGMGPAAPLGLLIIPIVVAPWLLLGAFMWFRGIAIFVMAFFGPILIGVKHTNLPVVSSASEKILEKSIAIVIVPIPIAPIMYILGNFVFTAVGTGAMFIPAVGAFFFFAIGCLLLFAVWSTFKIVSPTLAGAAGGLGKVAAAAGVVATGGSGSLAYSAIRGGPAAAAARYAGNRWGGSDGRR